MMTEYTINHTILTMKAERQLNHAGDYAVSDEEETYPVLHIALARVSGEPEDCSEEGIETRLWAANGISREPVFGDGQVSVYRGDKRERILSQFAGAIDTIEFYRDDDERFITG